MGGGYGLRLFAGFAGIVLVMLVVSGVVFWSLFGDIRDDIDRSELRAAGNALSVEIIRIMRRAGDADRQEVVSLIREQAEHAGLIVILTDGDGRVIPGFEPNRRVQEGRSDIRYSDIEKGRDASGWFDISLRVDGHSQPALVRVLIPQDPSGRVGTGLLMAVTFGDQHDDRSLDELVGRLIVSGLAGLAAAVVIATILSRQLMRPLEALTGVVRRFGPNRYDMRAAESGPSQVRELASAFNAMAERVSDNERAMRSLIADVSHELRTPLTSIRGFVEAMRDGTVVDPERRASSLDVVHDETRRMLRMIEQLLDLSRLEAGEHRLQPSAIDLDELFGYLDGMFGARAVDQGVELRLESDADVATFAADFDRLVQVFNNLLDNALRHTAEGSVTVTARTAKNGEAGLEFRIADTGEGIDSEDLEHLFDRFWQPASRTGPGAGLGLAISREIVRAHGGRIGAESELGVGTTITVWLPSTDVGSSPLAD